MADGTLKQNRDDKLANNANPVVAKLGNIYKAVVVTATSSGESLIDPRGQGRVAAYIPSLGMSPDEPRIFAHAQTGAFFNVPDKTGIEILVFFADHNSADDSYWFATTSDIVDVVAGGVLGNPHIDGSGIGEGPYSAVPVLKDTANEDEAELDGTEVKNSAFNKILGAQGTFTDDLRGPTTTSPRRDAGYKNTQHSKVYGVKTSGGSSISIDDGSIGDDGTLYPEQIKITTSSGAAVTLDGGNDFIYLVNSTGSGWVEIGANGEVMVYAKGSLNMRTQKDFNLRADKNINLEAGENINIHSIGDTKVNTDKELHLRSKGNQFLQSESMMNINVGVDCRVTTSGLLHLNGPEAPKSELILLTPGGKPDIDENLESTIIKDTIVSEMPTHEPFIRPHAPDPTTSEFAVESSSDEGKAAAGKSETAEATSTATEDENDTVEAVSDNSTTSRYGTVTEMQSTVAATRTLPIASDILSILQQAANATGLDVIVRSGGQDDTTGYVGTARHNHGHAADVSLHEGNRRLSLNNLEDISKIQDFLSETAKAGATGIGAGNGYMSNNTFHIGNASRHGQGAAAYWGGTSATSSNAPSWLREIFIRNVR